MTDERDIVLDILLHGEKSNKGTSAGVRNALDCRADLSDTQRSFIKRLADGCIGDAILLDSVIDMFSRKPVSKLRPVIRMSLRMGIYQILFMDSVPDSAACNEQVKLVRKYGLGELSGFVNAVLRNTARNRDRILDDIRNTSSLSVKYSIPDWILRIWDEQYGAARAEKNAAAMQTVRPLTVRTRPVFNSSSMFTDKAGRKISSEADLVSLWEKDGLRVSRAKWIPHAYYLSGTGNVRELSGFDEGLFTVQDEGSMMVAYAAGLSGGETVADVCAAPGGKALHCADLLLEKAGSGSAPAKGHVAAYDLSDKKVGKITENIDRLSLGSIVTAKVRDARELHTEDENIADVVICDLPCSGLGVMGRKKDIRYRVKREDLDDLQALQREILRSAVHYGKAGAVLIYSTCTIDRIENDDNAVYIQKELGLIPDPIGAYLPKAADSAVISGITDAAGKTDNNGNCLFMEPGVHGTDGFYVARFRIPRV